MKASDIYRKAAELVVDGGFSCECIQEAGGDHEAVYEYSLLFSPSPTRQHGNWLHDGLPRLKDRKKWRPLALLLMSEISRGE